jgi:hypothetical protein
MEGMRPPITTPSPESLLMIWGKYSENGLIEVTEEGKVNEGIDTIK